MADRNQKWEIDLCEIGKCESCLYSWCCTACAISEARSKMDGSGCSFNYMAMRSPVVIHWLMRSAYGIPSDNECVDDCMIPTCCTCCAVNQMYQTAMIRENPSTDGGSRFNLKAFSHESTQYSCNECMYSMCCSPCAIGTTLSNTVGMPFFMGCCCVSLCGARNIVRYQYRIGGDECFDDYCLPSLLDSAANFALACCCLFSRIYIPYGCLICSPICFATIAGVHSYFVAVIMKILKESEVQLRARGGVPGFYLSSPPASEMNGNRTVPASTVANVSNDHVTVPANAQYVQVATTLQLVDHAGGGGGPGQNSHVPIVYATVTNNYI